MKKLYAGMPDAEMLEQAQTIKDLFAGVLDDFEAYDEALNEEFALALQAKIDAAVKYPTDDTVNNEITEIGNSMKQAWKACSRHFQEARYFIEKAFPGNTTLHKVFGYSDYYKMTRSYKQVKPFMDLFGSAVDKYHAELLAVGYRQEDMDAIATLTTGFNNAVRPYINAKKSRSECAQTRTRLMNEVWRGIKIINTASKKIYLTNYARLKQFLMPAGAIKAKPVEG